MTCFHFLVSIFAAILLCSSASDGRLDRSFHKKIVTNYSTVIVDPSGHDSFSNIRSAIESVPINNNQWVHINVKAGQYREQVTIPYDKPYIYIQGEGKQKTTVTLDNHDSIATSATFISEAANVVVAGITFVNSYNYPPEDNRNPVAPAVAAMISGDKSAFYECEFLGLQDTLWDVQGRHYFKQCTILGAVDFIFGAGQSIYDECTISVAAAALHQRGFLGYITAQGRSNPSDASGFVFKNCDLIGNGKVYLGRPWRDYARVLFYNCTMSDIIVPQGWDPWESVGHENQLVFAEHYCRGIGADTLHRVPWESRLNRETLNQLISISFIDDQGWISSQPISIQSF